MWLSIYAPPISISLGNYVALSHLIDSKRRLGKLEESLTFIEAVSIKNYECKFYHETIYYGISNFLFFVPTG